MSRDTFSLDSIAEFINRNFVAIKVDRDERPDIARVYMTYVHAVTGKGVWPLSVWLTSDLKPFYGGTTFSADGRNQEPSFEQVANSIAAGWQHDRTRVKDEATRVVANLAENISTAPVGDSIPDLTEPAGDAFEQAYTYLFENFDEQNGGFGGAPKSPRPVNLEFLMRCASLQGSDSDSGREALGMVEKTLSGMATGGIRDIVFGGYYRYTLDDDWRVPYFEKRLQDQGQIAAALIGLGSYLGDTRFTANAGEVFNYVRAALKHPSGGYSSAEVSEENYDDAMTPGADLLHSLWAAGELRQLLGPDFSWFSEMYGIEDEGNVPTKYDSRNVMKGLNVLHQKRSLAWIAEQRGVDLQSMADSLENVLPKLRESCVLKRKSVRNEKRLAAGNGLLIAAFSRASISSDFLQPERVAYLNWATETAEFIRNELWDSNSRRLARASTGRDRFIHGLSDDYACLIAGLLDLYQASLDVRWLRWAREVQTEMDALFWDAHGGGYFNTSIEDQSVILRFKDALDGDVWSANSMAAVNLFRLSALLADGTLRKRAMKTIQSVRHVWSKTPWSVPGMLIALEWALSNGRCVTLIGDSKEPEFQAMLDVSRNPLGPRTEVRVIDYRADHDWMLQRLPADFPKPLLGLAAIVSTDAGHASPVETAMGLKKLLVV